MAKLHTIAQTKLLVASLLICGAVHAQAPDAAGTQVFAPDFFASSKPADAYDMVRKLPGFELIEVDDDVRGYTGSRGNILFDGRTPSGKQDSLEQMLKRIPAASVLRIELIRGGTKGAATGGFDLVANIVRRQQAASSGAASGGITASDEIGIKPDARIEYSREGARSRLETAIELATEVDEDSGAGAIVETDPDEAVSEVIGRDEREYVRTLSASAEHNITLGDGELVTNLSGSRAVTRETIRSTEDGIEIAAPERERIWSAEVGAQYERPVGGGTLEAILVQRTEWLDADAAEEDELFSENTRSSETLARAEYRQDHGSAHFFGSIEGALNKLTGDAKLTAGGVPVPITGSDVDVSERRAEAVLGANWQASRTLALETSLRAEYSAIRSTGDSLQDDDFLFWKPRLRVSWDNRRTRVQATLEREAAQLDFEDFVASVELDRDDVVAGAPSLTPPTTWSFTALVEQRFWDSGALTLTLRRERIDDVIDRVVVESGGEFFDAVGNIGRGNRTSLRAELTVPLDRIGLKGMEIRADLTFLKSRVTDPVTGAKRSISEDKPFEGEFRFTHDLPGGKWSWGLEASLSEKERKFRFDEVRREHTGTALAMHVEFRPTSQWRIRAEIENVTWKDLTDEREKYLGPRTFDILESIETRRINTDPIFTLSVRRAFGAGEG
ncbi:TonB-dependent receptor [Sphingomonas sp. RB56-2]|uniref:TonB-dependent receptor n=1 Tax=Sphingomonas brevis TaxID=2908206 RepID=A0ABT0S8S2_9SPHN|nr:TonB-dependent receptor [Sphingomonas brevis]MCL6740792.1 TonB-dependent receptor [Sphingomonas brevis]